MSLKTKQFFKSHFQQDAHEALLKLFDILHNITATNMFGNLVLSQPNSQILTSIIKQNFQGSIKSCFTCQLCGHKTISIDSCLDITIDIKGDIQQGLLSSLQDGVTKFCTSCNCNNKHLIEKTIWQQPIFSVIAIKRFQQLRTGRVTKNTATIMCNEHIAIPGFDANLIALVLHHGATTDSGHYTSVVKSADKWYICNDNSISITNLTDICMSKEVYMAFYHRVI